MKQPRPSAGAIAFMSGSLLLCWLLTLSFMESRAAIRARADGSAGSAETVRPYPGSIMAAIRETVGENGFPRLPRPELDSPGGSEPETTQPSSNSRRDAEFLPDFGLLREKALAAAESDDPLEIGNSLLALLLLRTSLEGAGQAGSGKRLLQGFAAETALRAGVISPADLERLASRTEGLGRGEWLPGSIRELGELEGRLLAGAAGGDLLRWLPAWAGGLAAGAAHPAASVSESRDRDGLGIDPAWTYAGYQLALGILSQTAGSGLEAWPERREEALASYRDSAFREWRRVSRESCLRAAERAEDDGTRSHLAGAAGNGDPARLMRRLLEDHLLRIFAGGSPLPEMEWLRRLESQFKSGEAEARRWESALAAIAGLAANPRANIDAVRRFFRSREDYGGGGMFPPRAAEGAAPDPLREGEAAAEALEARLRSGLGRQAVWEELSPVAGFRHLRSLAIRQAALDLDAVWREEVVYPYRLQPGGVGERWRRLTMAGGFLDHFLRESSGLWRLEGASLVNAGNGEASFLFNDAFLDFVNWSIDKNRFRLEDPLPIRLRIDGLDVDAGAGERPESLILIWRNGGGEQTLVYRNRPREAVWLWRLADSAELDVIVNFPSLTLRAGFFGMESAAGRLGVLADGRLTLSATDFPEQLEALRRLGVGSLVIRSRVGDPEPLRNWLDIMKRPIPERIVVNQFDPGHREGQPRLTPFDSRELSLIGGRP